MPVCTLHSLQHTDQAVRLAVDFICPGFPAHFLKVEDDHMLFRLKDHIGKTPIIIMTERKMDEAWEQAMKSAPQPESLISCAQSNSVDMLAYTVASEAPNAGDIARYAFQRCVHSPQLAATVHKRGE